ncbi:hypothetical protein NOM01_11190 [Sporolactobacillus sp. STSJ-5]|uniref:hypothetical protein n=1 Tax=Sporolactobacillus sp. STSJ-5 TaxID=2965076 RepID=UPI0021055597|nr:hypothetical protein [Sporolactobacillus sp. STSJ-5]
MARVALTPDDFNDDMIDYIQTLCRKAYEQGVQEGRDKYDLPMMLTRQHIAAQLQVSLPTVDRITSLPGFPRSKLIKSRFPRDAVFKFMEENIERVRQITVRRMKI